MVDSGFSINNMAALATRNIKKGLNLLYNYYSNDKEWESVGVGL
jgi:hypothetical protein